VTLSADEAIAIVQKLIHDRVSSAASPPYGPPTIDNVELGADGRVTCRACEITPAVAEAAILLQTLLPPGVPLQGGLRYALARALHEVDAPPFDSLDDFSAALSRYERGERTAAVRRLVRRAAGPVAAMKPLAHGERRRNSQAVVDVRRHLRDADRVLYEHRLAASRLAAPPRVHLPAALRTGMAVAVVVAMLAGAVAVLAVFHGSLKPAMPPLPVPAMSASVQRDIHLPADRAAPKPRAKRATVVRGRLRQPASPPPSRVHWWSIFPHIRFVDDFAPGRH
jgi:hypothetical protein